MNPCSCKHYSYAPGGKGPTCARGVDIRKHVGGPAFGWMARLPCVTTERSHEQVPCELHELPTAEEVAEEARLLDEAIARVLAVRSGCCNEPLIERGTARFCSKCKEFVARMCPAHEHEP